MKKLLSSEFFIIRKSLFIKIAVILGLVFSAFTIFQGLTFANFGNQERPEGAQDMPGRGMSFAIDGKSIFSSSFGLAIGFGIIVAILLAIMINNEFSNGTIRNKIIAGNSKIKVYLSMIIAYVSTGLILILTYSVIRLLLGTAILGYSEDIAFNINEFWYILQSLGLITLVYIVIFSVVILLATLLKNTGTTIIAVIGFVLLLNTTTNLYQLVSDWTWLETLCDFNPVNMISVITEDSFTTLQLLIIIFGSIGFASIAIGGGTWLFKRYDLK